MDPQKDHFLALPPADKVDYIKAGLVSAPKHVVNAAVVTYTGTVSPKEQTCHECTLKTDGRACTRMIAYTEAGKQVTGCASCERERAECDTRVGGRPIFMRIVPPGEHKLLARTLKSKGTKMSPDQEELHGNMVWEDLQTYAAKVPAPPFLPGAHRPPSIPEAQSEPTTPIAASAPLPGFLSTPARAPSAASQRSLIDIYTDTKLKFSDIEKPPAGGKKYTPFKNFLSGRDQSVAEEGKKKGKKGGKKVEMNGDGEEIDLGASRAEKVGRKIDKKETLETMKGGAGKGEGGRRKAGESIVALGKMRMAEPEKEGDEEEESEGGDSVTEINTPAANTTGTTAGTTLDASPKDTTSGAVALNVPETATAASSPPATPSKRAIRPDGEPIANRPKSKPSGRVVDPSGAGVVGGGSSGAGEGLPIDAGDSGLGAGGVFIQPTTPTLSGAAGPTVTSKDRRNGKSSPGRETPTKLTPPDKKRNALKAATSKAAEGIKKGWGKGVGGIKDAVSGRRGAEKGGAGGGGGEVEKEVVSGRKGRDGIISGAGVGRGEEGEGTSERPAVAAAGRSVLPVTVRSRDLLPLPDYNTDPLGYESALMSNVTAIMATSFRPPITGEFEVQQEGERVRGQVRGINMGVLRSLALALESLTPIKNERDEL